MLRALIVGVLAVSAFASCSKHRDAPAVAAGAAAGKVVELTGKVDATRDGSTRTLAAGAEVFADDTIATATDASVVIELFHNNARWSVVSGRTSRVDASLAWGLDKQAASAAVDHNSAAAGRNAERSAADTSATTGAPSAMGDEAPSAMPPAQTASVAPGAPAPRAAADDAPPAMPPARAAPVSPKASVPPPAKIESRKDTLREKEAADDGGGEAVVTGSRKTSETAKVPPPPPPPPPADPQAETARLVVSPQQRAEDARPEFEKCLDPAKPQISITIDIKRGKPTVSLSGTGNRSTKIRTCVAGVASKIAWLPGVSAKIVLKMR